MPTPTNPTPEGEWRPFITKGTETLMEFRRDGAEIILRPKAVQPPDPRDATITHLAALLDGVLADDPQAIRDAAAWLTVNRPTVDGGDTVGVRWLDSDSDSDGEGEG